MYLPPPLAIFILFVIPFIVGYLLGSIPFGVIFTRMAGLGDIRKIGSGNTGATNVLRTGNKKLAAATLLCDMLKGTAAVFLTFYFWPIMELGLIAGFGALLGHIFPVWLKFRGGKGVATYLGVMLGFFWPFAVVFVVVWLATALLTRYSSLSALVAVIVVPVCAWFFEPFIKIVLDLLPHFFVLDLVVPFSVLNFIAPEAVRVSITGGIALMSLLVILKHHANIRRLLNGTESRIGAKAG